MTYIQAYQDQILLNPAAESSKKMKSRQRQLEQALEVSLLMFIVIFCIRDF
jgi:hypothetical protein